MLLQGGGAAWIRIARTQPIKITFEQRNTMTGGLEVIGGLKEQEISHFCHNLRIASGSCEPLIGSVEFVRRAGVLSLALGCGFVYGEGNRYSG